MKQTVVGVVQRIAPGMVADTLRGGYHTARTHAASARYRYPARYLKVIAVTGMTGKTTTVYYLNSILKSAGFTTAMLSSETTEVAGVVRPAADVLTAQGVQWLLRQAKKADVDYVIVEAAPWALRAKLFHTVAFECVVVTNAEDDLDTREIARVLAYTPRYSVLNADDASYPQLSGYEAAEHKISYGTSEAADCRIRQVKLYRKGSEVQLLIDHHTKLELGTQLPGKHNVYDMTAAAMAAYLMYVKLEAIADGIADLAPIPGRYERLEEDTPYDVIVDSAPTRAALETVLDTARAMTKNRLIVVLHEPLADRAEIVARHADRIVVSGLEEAVQPFLDALAADHGTAHVEFITDVAEALTKARSIARTGDTVVVGSDTQTVSLADEATSNESLPSRDQADQRE